MVQKTVAITATEGATIAATVIIQDATIAAMLPRRDGAKDGDNSCEGSSSDRGGRGDSDYPGRDEEGDVAKKVMTAGVVAIVADAVVKRGSDGAEDVGNYGDCGGQVSYGTGGGAVLAAAKFLTATAVVAVEAMVPTSAANSSDSVGDVFKGTKVVESDAMVRKIATAAAKVLQATAVVAVTMTIQDATRWRCRQESDDGWGCSDCR
ncbi:hypothetical protein Bbelb_429800 [Branchiostoma belcheri]|nr:hypothetical protein Bbelb_429800 [Branchiostoma belcheri]